MSDRPEPYAPPAASSSGVNISGRVAVVLAAAALALGVTQQILSVFAPLIAQDVGAAFSQIAGVFGVLGGIHLALSIGAVIFGAVGISRRSSSQSPVAAAIGLGAGAVGVIGGLIGFAVIPLLAQAV